MIRYKASSKFHKKILALQEFMKENDIYIWTFGPIYIHSEDGEEKAGLTSSKDFKDTMQFPCTEEFALISDD